MKMTYFDVLNRHTALCTAGQKTLPRKAAYAMSRNLQKLEIEAKFYRNQVDDIANRYALKNESGGFMMDESGNNYTFANREKELAFQGEIKELLETEVEVDIIKFNAEELDKSDTCNRYDVLSPFEEATINWMVIYNE